MRKFSRSNLRARLGLALLVGLVPLTGGIAMADVVLHPGTVQGTVGLNTWNFPYGSVQISGNSNGFYASGPISNDTYTLTVEGDQAYSAFYVYAYTGSNSYFSMSTTSPVTVPIGGTITADLARPGGTLDGQVNVTGGTLAQSYFTASAYNATNGESYTGQAYGYPGADAAIPMAASNAITIGGYATINVTASDGSLICTTQRAITAPTVTLADGARTPVVIDISVSAADCATGIGGLVALNNAPGGVGPTDTYVYASGSTFKYEYLTGNNQPYFLALEAGNYWNWATSYFYTAPYNGGMTLPHQAYVTVVDGQTTTRDFVFNGASVGGQLVTSGTWYARSTYGQMNFAGIWDYQFPDGGLTGNASAWQYVAEPAGVYKAMLTEGDWTQQYAYLQFYDPNATIPINSWLYAYQPQVPFTLVQGTNTNLPTQDVATAEASIIFDVDEQGGPVIGISNPTIYAYTYINNQYQYVGSSSSVQNVNSPTVRMVATPGSYTFDAYATVAGSWVRFATSTLDIGQGGNTPTGSNVTITPTGPTGASLNMSMTFEGVTNSGTTNVSTTSVGPAAPNGHFMINSVSGAKFVDITTSADFSGKVEVCIPYDPTGLTPAQEAQVKLMHYVCSTPISCSWQAINEVSNPHTPPYTSADPLYFGRTGFQNPNTSANYVCGVTTSFSIFGAAVPLDETGTAPTGTCVGSEAAPALISTDAGVCSAAVDNVNRLAGSCDDAGGGLASCTFNGADVATLAAGTQTVTVVGTANDGSSASCDSTIAVVDREAPAIGCPTAVTTECTGPLTNVSLQAPCDDNCATCTASCGSGAFGLGSNVLACNATDDSGNSASCQTAVQVVDTTAPTLSLNVSPLVIWPPNHKLVPIATTTSTSDTCDSRPVVSCNATSNEAPLVPGSGNTNPDIVVKNGQLLLRAERAGTGTGRTYTVSCTSTDASGNATTATALVRVPVSQ